MNTHFRASDFDPPNRWNGPFIFLLAAIVLCLTNSGSFWLGMKTQDSIHAEAKRMEDAKPKRASSLVNPPASLLPNCDARDFIEFRRTCKGRMRAGAIQ